MTVPKTKTSASFNTIPKSGATSLDKISEPIKQLVYDVRALSNYINTYFYPIANSLPVIDAQSINVFLNGFDCDGFYVDNEATSTSRYYDVVRVRPTTAREAFDNLYTIVNTFSSQVTTLASQVENVGTGFTDADKIKIGASLWPGLGTSSASSPDGKANEALGSLDGLALDLYDVGTAIYNTANFATAGSLTNQTFESMITWLLEGHQQTWDAVSLGTLGHDIRATRSPTDAWIYVKNDTLTGVTNRTSVPLGVTDCLHFALDRLAFEIGELRGNASWQTDPSRAYAGGPISLEAHMLDIGTGAPGPGNTHGLNIRDIEDGVRRIDVVVKGTGVESSSGDFTSISINNTDAANEVPVPRQQGATAPYSVQNSVLMFGGRSSDEDDVVLFNDTWVWDGETWKKPVIVSDLRNGISLSGAFGAPSVPAPRYGHKLVEIDTGHILMFGGTNGIDYFDDLWAWTYDAATNVGFWREIQQIPATPGGDMPESRARYAICNIASYDYCILCGGYYQGGVLAAIWNDTWKLDYSTIENGYIVWTEISPVASYGPNCDMDMDYDQTEKKILMYGGQNNPDFTYQFDPHAMILTWHHPSVTTSPGNLYYGHDVIYIPAPTAYGYSGYGEEEGAIFCIGGASSAYGITPVVSTNKVWQWDWATTEWIDVSPTTLPTPSTVCLSATCFSPALQETVDFGQVQGSDRSWKLTFGSAIYKPGTGTTKLFYEEVEPIKVNGNVLLEIQHDRGKVPVIEAHAQITLPVLDGVPTGEILVPLPINEIVNNPLIINSSTTGLGDDKGLFVLHSYSNTSKNSTYFYWLGEQVDSGIYMHLTLLL